METAPDQPKKQSPILRIFMIFCAVIVLLSGVAKMWQGMKGMGGKNSAEFTQLLKESDAAVEEANRASGEATPLFQQMMNDVDSKGLDAVRAEQGKTAIKTGNLFGKSAEQFRLAEQKIETARSSNKNDKLTPFLARKAESYGLFAQVFAINQEMIQLAFDPAIPTLNDLLPKLQAAAARRDELEKKAKTATDEATEIGARLTKK